jgi:hypothetical protein
MPVETFVTARRVGGPMAARKRRAKLLTMCRAGIAEEGDDEDLYDRVYEEIG